VKILVFGIVLMAAVLAQDDAFAQQQPIPLTGERAALENDLAKLSMPRDAHAAVFNILQAYERQAQAEKMRQQTPPVEPPK
jgi:hypothetical protein